MCQMAQQTHPSRGEPVATFPSAHKQVTKSIWKLLLKDQLRVNERSLV